MTLLYFLLIFWVSISSIGLQEGFAQTTVLPSLDHLECDSNFVCPEGLKGRVAFWMKVYFLYGKNDAVFHDPDNPERIYSVIKTDHPCPLKGENEPIEIKAERERIEALLLRIRDRKEDDPTPFTEDETRIRSLFGTSGDDLDEELSTAIDTIRCQQGGRERFEEALESWGLYREFVLAAIDQLDLPIDLQYLPFVESSYNTFARSRVDAVGLWQLMPRTARHKGLLVDDRKKGSKEVDQRMDPFLATEAALTFLQRDLLRPMQKTLEKEGASVSPWPFVLTSYNYGLKGMQKAIKNVGPNFVDVLENHKGRRFGTAAKNFYASFLAARHLAQHHEQFFPGIQLKEMPRFVDYTLPRAVSLTRLLNHLVVSEDVFRPLNPAIGTVTFLPKDLLVRLPVSAEKDWETELAKLDLLPPETTTQRVAKGDTLIGLSKSLGISVQNIMSANHMIHPRIYVGQKLIIPAVNDVAVPVSGGAR